MIRFMIKVLFLLAAGMSLYKYRYRLMNMMLGVPALRRFAVGSAMSFPGVRSKVMDDIFE
ncbi:hypothetical protein ACFFJY_08230 [Fictibacillus aquaticus]|uniref:Sodium:proton antiporter n=1 Tax=Fictibacillus aquaticus TaxID=2021314 RepID=A0A235F904_9BACL|nr:hypothetical protein [Fictibacillus aquaticus]OYD57841.1 hypothetical protein CGZ90_08030 [Fictibacillus aquaticus]